VPWWAAWWAVGAPLPTIGGGDVEALVLVFWVAVAVLVVVGGARALTEKKCPDCAGRVKKEARVCAACGYRFP
jgi:hypothetical protein